MRFVLAIISFVIAALLIGAGIAQRTIFLPPSQVTASVSIDSDAPVTVIDGKTLNTYPRIKQRLDVAGADSVLAAYGRTTDVEAWVGTASYNKISYDAETQQLASTLVEGTEQAVPSPAGSDLWLAEFPSGPDFERWVKVPAGISFVIVSDGTAPAPADVSVSWPLDDSTPWAGPLLIGGGAVLLLGLGLLLWAITHVRRARGPRRKSPKMPKLPKQPRYKPSRRPKALPSSTRGRRSTRTAMVAIPIAIATVVAMSGCSGQASPPPAVAVEAQTVAPAAVESTPPPAVTELQAKRIIGRVADVAAEADEELDPELLAERFAGAALDLRTANYKIRKLDDSEPAAAKILTDVQIILPQQNEEWPRTVFAVVQDPVDETIAPVAMMLVQDDARSQYKVHYAMNLEPGAFPDVAGTTVGTQRLLPDTALFTLEPAQLATAYGDILNKDEKSDSFGLFDSEGDGLREAVGLTAKKKAQKALPKTAKLVFSNEPGAEETIVLATVDGGAIVATQLNETQTVKPVKRGATVNAPKSIKALSGKAVSTKGLKAVYGDQLLFYIPNKVQGGPIRLLGYGQGLISASELKK